MDDAPRECGCHEGIVRCAHHGPLTLTIQNQADYDASHPWAVALLDGPSLALRPWGQDIALLRPFATRTAAEDCFALGEIALIEGRLP